MKMKLSEVTTEDVKRHLKIDSDYDDERISEIIPMAKGRLLRLTNRTAEELDGIAEIVQAFYQLCEDYYDGTDEHEKSVNTICHSVQFNMVN